MGNNCLGNDGDGMIALICGAYVLVGVLSLGLFITISQIRDMKAGQEASEVAFDALDDEFQDVHIDLLAEIALLQARMDGTLNRNEKRVWQ
jgi:hypothetical protein